MNYRFDNAWATDDRAVTQPFLDEALPARSELQPSMTVNNDIAGTTALAIIESLLLAMADRKLLPQKEIIGLLEDVAAAYENAPREVQEGVQQVVDDLIRGIRVSGNSPGTR